MVTSVQWSCVGPCTLWITVSQVASRHFSQHSHMAFTLICFIFICFFSSFFCSRRRAASCRQGQGSEWAQAISSRNKQIISEPNKALQHWVHSSPGAFLCFRKEQQTEIKVATGTIPTGSPGDLPGGICQQPVATWTPLTSSRRCFSGSSSFMIRSFSARFFSSRRDWAASCLCTWVSLRKFSSTRALFLSAFCLPFAQRKANAVCTDFPTSRMQDLYQSYRKRKDPVDP